MSDEEHIKLLQGHVARLQQECAELRKLLKEARDIFVSEYPVGLRPVTMQMVIERFAAALKGE